MKTLALILLIFATTARAEDRVGRFYEIGHTDAAPSFVQKIHVTRDAGTGRRTSASTIEDAEGHIVMRENAEMEGAKILSQTMEQLQIGEVYELETKGDQATFRTFKLVDGKREKVSEKTQSVDDQFVTGPSTLPFLKAHESTLLTGERVPAQFGIFEFEKTIGFDFRKISDAANGPMVVKMKISSFFLSIVVDSLEFVIDPKTFQMLRYKGRTPVRKKVNGDWKPLDAEIVYSDI